MRALAASPEPMAGVPVTPNAGSVAARVYPQCVTGWSGASAYTVSAVPPSMVTIKSPFGCTANPDTALPASVCCHNSRVARAAAAVRHVFVDLHSGNHRRFVVHYPRGVGAAVMAKVVERADVERIRTLGAGGCVARIGRASCRERV